MAKKEKTNYKEMTPDEMRTELIEAQEKLSAMRFHNASAPLKNPHQISNLRKHIARLNTFMRQKSQGGRP
jgi:ribosomal protein L29